MKSNLGLAFTALLLGFITPAYADSDLSSTPNVYGTIGLNTIPSARMDKPGTLRLNLSASDPYLHTSLGYQISDRFYLGLRQTGEVSNLRADPKHLFPGLDLKLKLFDEKTFRPEIALGLQSAFGHKRMAGEYLTFSKRYNDFDFTAGFGWGRFGTRNSVPNPLDWTDSYLSHDRYYDGEKPNSPKNWFTGDTGFFAGVEYATPWKGLSVKADWSSDSYKAERALGQDGPSPFSFGLTYKPAEWIDAGVAIVDKDTVMARISLKTMLSKWPFSSSNREELIDISPDLTDKNIVKEAKKHHLNIRNILPNDQGMSGQIYLRPETTTPKQLSQAWRIITNKTSQESPNILRLEPVYFGLRGPGISISRRDLQAAADNKGSEEEMWQHISFDNDLSKTRKDVGKFMPYFTLRENFSMSEDDGGIYHRTDLLATLERQIRTNFLSHISLRYALFSNLHRFSEIRSAQEIPIRSDIDYYTQNRLAVDRMFAQGFKSFTPNWHASVSAGYLEEMFAGYHGEILYRPWAKSWAIGIEAAEVIKRSYNDTFNMGFFDEKHRTGYLNFYYEFPDTDMTFHASVGQYLAGDRGGSLSLQNRFKNGSTIEALITATGMNDPDVYGSTSNLYAGFKFSLPLGSIPYVLDGSSIDVNALPLGRDAGQRLDIAHPLYEMTEPLSYRHLTQNWSDVAD